MIKKILSVILILTTCFLLCSCSNNENIDLNPEQTQSNVTVKPGAYLKTDTYIVSTGQKVFNEYTQTEFIYLEDGCLLWYVQSGVLWTCRNYNFIINEDKICCTPKYNNGLLVDIMFSYDEDTNEIKIELNDVMLVFSYHSNSKPVDNVYQNH